jgi:Flp pilus assembly protein TadD
VAENQPERAVSRFDARIARDPADAVAQNLRGDLLVELKRPAEAVPSYVAASKLAPRWSQPYRGRATALEAGGQSAQAIEALEAGLAATDYSLDIAFDLGAMYERTGRADDAIALFEKVSQRNPNDPRATNNLAMLLANHRSDAASLERASSLAAQFKDSDNAALLDTYGWVLYRRGQFTEAVTVLQKAADKMPQAAELRYHLGMAQLKAGMKEDARSNLQKAVEAGQSFVGLDEARSALAGLK